MRPFFIGHTRFSVHQYGSSSFKATSARGGLSKTEYTRWLYSDDRLGVRVAVFVQESLPQLQRASANHGLVHIVTISPTLPQKYKDILWDASSRYSFLRIHETRGRVASSHPSLKLAKKVLRDRGMEGQIFGIYRLDDDDLLPADYFDRMSSYMTPEHIGFRLSLSQGIAAIRVQERYVLPWTFYEAKSSAGLLGVHYFSADGKHIYGLHDRRDIKGHQKADRNFPVIVDGRNPGFFRARHQTQDNTLDASTGPFFSRLMQKAYSRPRAAREAIVEKFPHVSDLIIESAEQLVGAQSLLDGSTQLDSQKLTRTCHIQSPMLLSASVGGDLDAIDVHLRITLEQAADHEAENFLLEAGFTRNDEKSFYRPACFQDSQIIDVIEPPPGSTITNIEISTSDVITLRKLAVAPMKNS